MYPCSESEVPAQLQRVVALHHLLSGPWDGPDPVHVRGEERLLRLICEEHDGEK